MCSGGLLAGLSKANVAAESGDEPFKLQAFAG
jgi:hypothetical protein